MRLAGFIVLPRLSIRHMDASEKKVSAGLDLANALKILLIHHFIGDICVLLSYRKIGIVFGACSLLLHHTTLYAQSTVNPTGDAKPFSNMQDSIALNFYMSTSTNSNDPDTATPLGTIRYSAAPLRSINGGTLANGQSLVINSYSALNTVLGNSTVYGGDTTTFKLPTTSGRALVGVGTYQNEFWSLGRQKGTLTNTLTIGNLPVHTHPLPGGGSTPATGSPTPIPINNIQLSTGVNYLIRYNGLFPTRNTTGDAAAYIGTVIPWAGATSEIPLGYTLADGRTMNTSGEFAALYAVIGGAYGGNNSTTFALPNLRGKTILGAGERPGASYGAVVGETLGQNQVTLNLSTMPAHTHVYNSVTTGVTGGGLPIDNRQPSVAMSYLIATSATFPTSESVLDIVLGDIVAFAGNYVPPGFLLADGRTLNVADYSQLGSLLTDTYGGNGTTTFALPDLRTRVAVAAGAKVLGGTNIAAFMLDEDGDPVFTLGEVSGASDYQLTVDDLAPHAVPEPGTISAVLLLGIAGVFGLRRRCR